MKKLGILFGMLAIVLTASLLLSQPTNLPPATVSIFSVSADTNGLLVAPSNLHGHFGLTNGLNTAPSLYFKEDEGTGIYLLTSNQMAFTAGTFAGMYISQSTIQFLPGETLSWQLGTDKVLTAVSGGTLAIPANNVAVGNVWTATNAASGRGHWQGPNTRTLTTVYDVTTNILVDFDVTDSLINITNTAIHFVGATNMPDDGFTTEITFKLWPGGATPEISVTNSIVDVVAMPVTLTAGKVTHVAFKAFGSVDTNISLVLKEEE